MREIKFRAYDKSEKKMKEVTEIHFAHGKAVAVELMGDHCYEYLHLTHADLMQFTGLRDKNGVEIYEGDIVKAPYPKGVFGYVFVHFGQFMFKTPEGGAGWIGYYGDESMEVLGNIYENKELLEAEG